MKDYYVTKSGEKFELRQTRFEDDLKKGKEHPYDLCAASFTKEGMSQVIASYFQGKVDTRGLL